MTTSTPALKPGFTSTAGEAAQAASLRIKHMRMDLKRELKQPDIPIDQRLAILADAIQSAPDWLQKIDVYKLLTFGPGIGEDHARWLIEAKLGIRRRPLLRELTERQRNALADLVKSGSHDFYSSKAVIRPDSARAADSGRYMKAAA